MRTTRNKFTKHISITLPIKTLEALDVERGTIPRSNYISDLLFFALADEEDLKGLTDSYEKP